MQPRLHDGLFIGLISGTSLDGVDGALIRIDAQRCKVIAALTLPYPRDLHADLQRAIFEPQSVGIDGIGSLDVRVGRAFGEAANAVLQQANVAHTDVIAVGSHGQTVRHQPDSDTPYTLQLGDPNIISATTGITTVADFRRRDVAEGGEGAPLAPAFHHWLLGDADRRRVVLNLGGVANVTLLADNAPVTGFDTGPANSLLDAWFRRHHPNGSFDRDGDWARSGTVSASLLDAFLRDEYFLRTPPKSTGFEYFNIDWVDAFLEKQATANPPDVQATLAELTAASIARAIRDFAADEVIVCGGGAHNLFLTERLQVALQPAELLLSADFGVDPDYVEAACFGWLARQTLAGHVGNLPSVSGARRPAVLGGIYLCAS